MSRTSQSSSRTSRSWWIPKTRVDRARVHRERTRLRALVRERVAAQAAEVSERGESNGADGGAADGAAGIVAKAPAAAGAKRERAADAGRRERGAAKMSIRMAQGSMGQSAAVW